MIDSRRVTSPSRWHVIGLLALLLFLCPVVALAQDPPTHTVERGETLFGIARQYDLSIEELQRLNDLDSPTIRVGQELIVGTAEETAPDEEEMEEVVEPAEEAPAPEPGVYRVPEETRFFDIAQTLGVSVDTLVSMNAETLRGPLVAGQELRVPEDAEEGTATTTHTVSSGENLSRIAQRYEISLGALREANDLRSDVLQVGQELTIPGQQAAIEIPEPLAEGRVLRYPGAFDGRLTASGDTYDPEGYTVSHRSLSFGTIVLLVNPASEQEVFARVNDRGPVDEGYRMEVSTAVAEALDLPQDSPQELRIYAFE